MMVSALRRDVFFFVAGFDLGLVLPCLPLAEGPFALAGELRARLFALVLEAVFLAKAWLPQRF